MLVPHPDSILIDQLGGPTLIASWFEISPQAVSMWRSTGIPRSRRMYLELKHPEVFGLVAGALRDDTGLSTEPAAEHEKAVAHG